MSVLYNHGLETLNGFKTDIEDFNTRDDIFDSVRFGKSTMFDNYSRERMFNDIVESSELDDICISEYWDFKKKVLDFSKNINYLKKRFDYENVSNYIKNFGYFFLDENYVKDEIPYYSKFFICAFLIYRDSLLFSRDVYVKHLGLDIEDVLLIYIYFSRITGLDPTVVIFKSETVLGQNCKKIIKENMKNNSHTLLRAGVFEFIETSGFFDENELKSLYKKVISRMHRYSKHTELSDDYKKIYIYSKILLDHNYVKKLDDFDFEFLNREKNDYIGAFHCIKIALEKDGMLLKYLPISYCNEDNCITAILQNRKSIQFVPTNYRNLWTSSMNFCRDETIEFINKIGDKSEFKYEMFKYAIDKFKDDAEIIESFDMSDLSGEYVFLLYLRYYSVYKNHISRIGPKLEEFNMLSDHQQKIIDEMLTEYHVEHEFCIV